MNTFFNIYLICAILGLVLYPGIWKEDFAVYANGRVKDRKRDYIPKDFYIGGMIFALVPLLNMVFVLYSMVEFFLYRKWREK